MGWTARRRRSTKEPTQESRIALVDAPGARQTLVFGLSWSALLGSRIPRLAARRARHARFTHYVFGGSRGASVGGIRAGNPGRRREWHSAAQCFACAIPQGCVAVVLGLGRGRYWVAAAHDGAVIVRTDQVFDTLAAAVDALAELRATHPRLLVYGDESLLSEPGSTGASDDDAHTASVLPNPRKFDIADLFAGCHSRTRLLRVRRAGIPGSGRQVAVGVMLVFAGAAALASLAWRQARRVEPVHAAPAPQAAWQRVLTQFARDHAVHPPNEVQRLLHGMRAIPLSISGWELSNVRCTARGAHWQCGARYLRRASRATNAALLAVTPSAWRVEFKLLDEATASWAIPIAVRPLPLRELASGIDITAQLGSYLQRIRPLFRQISVGGAQPEKIIAPLDDHGRPFDAPAPAPPAVYSRRIAVDGPLRSFALFEHPPGLFAWDQAELRVRNGQRSSLANSPLTIEVKGKSYETQ